MTPEERSETIRTLLAKNRYDFADLVAIMAILRLPGGCVWDAEQTHKSIRDNMIEETYEVVEAIDNDDSVLLREELGDALLQVVFHARIEEESRRFNIDDVVSDISSKLIHRHPHVFGSISADTTEQVLQNWEAIKTEEKKRDTLVSRLEAVPQQLPALMRASKIAKKTEFWYEEMEGSDGLESTISAISSALGRLSSVSSEETSALLGVLLYETVRLCRKLSVSAEAALTAETTRRIDEIRKAEAVADGIPLESMTAEERVALRARLDALQ